MAELEIHHETEHEHDPVGKKIGILAAVLAVLLAIVTIASHRTHTDAIIQKSTSNDQWAFYQATRIKLHNVELGEQLATLLGGKDTPAAAILAKAAEQKKKYEDSSKKIHDDAEKFEGLAKADEDRALRYDIGEGLLEIALVLSSLYFISKKMMFPAMGVISGLLGIGFAITGLMI